MFTSKLLKSARNSSKKIIDKVLFKLKEQKLYALIFLLFSIFLIGSLSFIGYKSLKNGSYINGNITNETKSDHVESDNDLPDEEGQLDDESDTGSQDPSDSGTNGSSTSSTVTTTTINDNQESEPDPESEPEPEPDPEPDPEPEPEPEPESPSAYVAYYADNQSDSDEDDENHQRVVNYILASGANPVFHAGDVMEDGTQDSMDRFNAVAGVLLSSRIFYAALGNNDRKVGDPNTPSQIFLDNFSFPNNEQWYSTDYGNLHMIILDSAFSWSNPTQQSWFVSDLQSSSSQSKITGVMFHHPTFKDAISQKLIDYNVDFVISGHWHSYQHTEANGIQYFVLSGQPNIGYMLAWIYSDSVSMKVYNNSNSLVDSIEFSER